MELKCPNAFLKSLKKSRIYCTSYKSGDSLKLFSFESSLSFAYSYTLSYTWRRKIFPRHWKYTVQREYLYEEILLRILLTQSFKCPLLILFKIEKLSIFIILCSLYNRNYLIDSLKMQIILKEENINHSSVICWEMCVFPDRWQEIGNLELKWFQ